MSEAPVDGLRPRCSGMLSRRPSLEFGAEVVECHLRCRRRRCSSCNFAAAAASEDDDDDEDDEKEDEDDDDEADLPPTVATCLTECLGGDWFFEGEVGG